MPWNRQIFAELRQDPRPIVVELVQMAHRKQRCVTTHAGLFVHHVDRYAALGLLRLVSESPSRWTYTVVGDTDSGEQNRNPSPSKAPPLPVAGQRQAASSERR